MKEGEIYIHKKGLIFKVRKIYDEPTILMEMIGHHNDQVIDTVKTWEAFKMKKLFP